MRITGTRCHQSWKNHTAAGCITEILSSLDLDQTRDAPSTLVLYNWRYVSATRAPISFGIEPVKCARVVRGLESHHICVIIFLNRGIINENS